MGICIKYPFVYISFFIQPDHYRLKTYFTAIKNHSVECFLDKMLQSSRVNNVRRGVQIYSILITRNSTLLSRITRIIFLFGKLSRDKQVHCTER